MSNPIDDKAFDAMNEVEVGNKIDLFKEKNYADAEESFNAFIKKLNSSGRYIAGSTIVTGTLSENQIAKLKEFWEQGGKPLIDIKPKGGKGAKGDKNRAYFSSALGPSALRSPDTMTLFDHNLFNHFLAEVSHAIKYARKPGESDSNWLRRREDIRNKRDIDYGTFDRARYGHTNRKTGKKYFPVDAHHITYRIEIRDGKEVAVDSEGNVHPDMKIPEWKTTYDEEGKVTERERATSWVYPWNYVEFDPKTRLGVGGQPLTGEFEAHSVVQDSLLNEINKIMYKK